MGCGYEWMAMGESGSEQGWMDGKRAMGL